MITIFYRFRSKKIIDFFRPSVLMLMYMALNLFVGVYILENDLLYYDRYIDIIGHKSYSLSLFLLCHLLLSAAVIVPTRSLSVGSQKLSNPILVILLFCIGFVLILPLKLPSLGLNGSVSIYVLIGLLPLVLMSIKSVRLFSLISIVLLVIGSQVFFDNKREVIFLSLLVIALFALKFFRFRAYHVIISMMIGIFTVLYLSLLRGYGGYSLTNFEKLFVVFDYALNPDNLGFIITNFELESASCNAIKNVECILDGSLRLSYGEGFLKPFTMFIPRWLWSEKPINYVTHYTTNVYPRLWEEGVSLPVLLVSEFFGSIKWLALIVFPVFILLLDRLYLWLLGSNSIVMISIGLVLSSTAIQYARGSGLEMYLYPLVFGLPFYILLWKN